MKYVKLFESWLNTVNEAVMMDTTKITEFGLVYDSETDKNADKIAKKIVNGVTKMFSNAPEDYKITISSKVLNKNITLSTKLKGGDDSISNKFTFSIENTIAEVSPNPKYLLGFTGSAEVGNDRKNPTTLAQFINSVVTGNELEQFSNEDKQNYIDAVESLISISNGNAPKMLSSKKGKQAISKMTEGEFYTLPSKKKTEIFNTILRGNFKAIKSSDSDDYYVIAPTKQLSDKYKIAFNDDQNERLGQRYMAFKLPTFDSDKNPKSSLGNMPITVGYTDKRFDETKSVSEPVMARNFKLMDEVKTTLGALLFTLLNLVDDGMKFGSNSVVASQDDIFTALRVKGSKYDVQSEATKKMGSEAWKQSTEAVDIAPTKVK